MVLRKISEESCSGGSRCKKELGRLACRCMAVYFWNLRRWDGGLRLWKVAEVNKWPERVEYVSINESMTGAQEKKGPSGCDGDCKRWKMRTAYEAFGNGCAPWHKGSLWLSPTKIQPHLPSRNNVVRRIDGEVIFAHLRSTTTTG
jgi:hypothetical protein